MPWPTAKLSEICIFDRGLTYTKSDEVNVDGTPVLRANNIDLAKARLDLADIRYISTNVVVPNSKRTKQGGLLICTASGSKAHLGKIAYIDDAIGWAFGGFMGQITAKPSVDSRYLYYILISEAFRIHLEKRSDGVLINKLKVGDIGDFAVPLPPLTEQQRIAAILDEAFAGIAKATANAERNIENARELFATHLARSMKTDNAATFHRSTTKQGWTETTLGESCEMYQPKTISTKEMDSNGTFPVFGANGQIGFYDKYNHERPEILVTCRGATCGTVNVSLPKSWVTGNAMVVRPKDNSISQDFLRYLLQGGIDLSKAITGAAQPQITRTNLNPLRFSYPADFVTQEEIVAKLDQASVVREQLVTIYTAKLAALSKLRTSLLHRAFTGQLTNASAVAA